MSIYGVIYGLHDPETGELRYIGQTTTSLKERLWSHLGPSNRRKNYYSARWINSLIVRGLKPEARLRATASSREELDRLEIEHISQALASGARLTNHAKGGQGPEGCKHTPEWCRRMAQLMAGRCTNTPEHMAKLAEAKRGVPRSQEVRDRISEAKKGQPSPNKGIPMPDAVKAKVSASRKGKLKGSTHHQYRHDISTDAILQKLASGQSKVEIAEELGVSPTFVHRRLNQAGRQPKPEVPMDLVLQRLTEGATLRAVSEEVGFPYMTVWRRVQQHRKAA